MNPLKTPKDLLPVSIRAVGAVAALAIVLATVAVASRASEEAVTHAQAALNVQYVELPRVEVVGKRIVDEPLSASTQVARQASEMQGLDAPLPAQR